VARAMSMKSRGHIVRHHGACMPRAHGKQLATLSNKLSLSSPEVMGALVASPKQSINSKNRLLRRFNWAAEFEGCSENWSEFSVLSARRYHSSRLQRAG
jgi:hypothetical protein